MTEVCANRSVKKENNYKMKKIFLLVAIASTTFATSFAQDIPERKTEKPGMHHGEKKKGHHGMNFKELNLTEAQKQQFKTQREEFKAKTEVLKKNDNITVKEWRSKMEALKKDQKIKFESILTTEQKDKMQKMKTDGEAKRKEMHKKGGAMMKERLSLTNDQSTKLDKNRTEMMEKTKTIRENKSLTDEQKKEQIKELHKKQKENMKSILTEEQLKKLKESPRHHKRQHKDEKSTPSSKTV